jgi:hypothetical protein
VHYLRDPRTGHFNFDQHLHKLTDPQDFDFDALPPFVPASRDHRLHQLAAAGGCAFVSSTSAISASLSTLYQFVNRSRLLDLEHLSQAFSEEPRNFTLVSRQPVGVLIKRSPEDDGVWSIVGEKPTDEAPTVLSQLGHCMERLLTHDPASYARLLRKNSGPLREEKGASENNYTYTQMGKFLLRSQIDCYDGRLPRPTFDLKTRASLPVRMDVLNYHK